MVSGIDFRYLPEYDVVPHCKFGEKVVRASYGSTVRITCESPPNDDVTSPLNFEISLNGVDFTSSGLKFNYYLEPKIFNISADSGQARGGTVIYIFG